MYATRAAALQRSVLHTNWQLNQFLRVPARFFGQAAAIRRAFHRANSSHRKFFQQAFSARSAFAPCTDHLHPDLLKRVATVCLQQLSICPHPIDLHAARPAFVVAHPLLVRLEAVDAPGHVLVPVTMRTQVRDDASDVAVQQPGLDLRQARLVRVIAPDQRLVGRRGVFQRVPRPGCTSSSCRREARRPRW